MPGNWGEGYRVVIKGKINGQVTNTIFHFAKPTITHDGTLAGMNAVLKQLANAVHECVLDTLIPALSAGWSYEFTEAYRISPSISDPIMNDNPVVTAGTAGAQGVNQAVQLITLRSGVGGRNGRGRNFLPPAGENVATAGQWDPAQVALLAAFAACMATKFVGPSKTTDYSLGVLSRTLYNNQPNNLATAFHEVATITAEPIISNMSRRKMGRGV